MRLRGNAPTGAAPPEGRPIFSLFVVSDETPETDCRPSGHMALAAQAFMQHETKLGCGGGAWTNIRGRKMSCMYLDYSWLGGRGGFSPLLRDILVLPVFTLRGPPSSAAIYSLAKKNTFASMSLSKHTQALPDPWWVSASCRQATRREVLSS